MNKIIDIAKSWLIAANPNEQQLNLAKKRLSICNGCEYMVESVVFEYKCDECGCPISKKIFSVRKGSCRLGKWNKVDGL